MIFDKVIDWFDPKRTPVQRKESKNERAVKKVDGKKSKVKPKVKNEKVDKTVQNDIPQDIYRQSYYADRNYSNNFDRDNYSRESLYSMGRYDSGQSITYSDMQPIYNDDRHFDEGGDMNNNYDSKNEFESTYRKNPLAKSENMGYENKAYNHYVQEVQGSSHDYKSYSPNDNQYANRGLKLNEQETIDSKINRHFGGNSYSNKFKPRVIHPKTSEDIQEIIDNLLYGEAVIVEIGMLSDQSAQRAIDYISGAVYALYGTMEKVEKNIYIVSPGQK